MNKIPLSPLFECLCLLGYKKILVLAWLFMVSSKLEVSGSQEPCGFQQDFET